MLRSPDAAQRRKRVYARLRRAMALRAVLLRRAGAVQNAGVWCGPGSAKQREERCIAPGTRDCCRALVIAGLDPAIHPVRKSLANMMDTRAFSPKGLRPRTRVKPAYDAAFPGRSAARSGALQSRGRTKRRCLVRSRFCEAALRAASRPGHENANSEFKFQTAKRLRSRAAARGGLSVDLPLLEGRRNAERRTLGQRPRLVSRIAGKQRHTATPLSVPPRRLLRPWDRFFRARARAFLAIQAGFPTLHPSRPAIEGSAP